MSLKFNSNMKIDSTQKKRSPREKFMQMMRNILKFSSFPPPTEVRLSSSQSPSHRHHPTVKLLQNPTSKRQNSRHVDGLNQEMSSSFIKIQGIDHHDTGRVDETSEVKAAAINLMVSDYIKTFHERNKHESVSLVLPLPPPPLPPRLHQGRVLLK